MTTPEFSRLWRLDRIGAGDTIAELTATPEECAALAQRFGLVAIDRLAARFALHRETGGIVARGQVTAAVTQRCVVTDLPLATTVAETVALRFLPESEVSGEEVELGEEEMDVIFYSGGAVDLGEATAETLALALDPFPRSPDADTALREAGVLTEMQASPFAALAALKQ